MAYDEELAERIRRVVGPRADASEKKMFGGVAFLLDGKMFVGVVKDDLMARVGPARYDAALAEEHVRPMDFTGRPMVGYVFVGPGGLRGDHAVERWVAEAAAFVATLEPPEAKRRSPPRSRAR
jgi:TfoX/Sxy family transcriptional regulator of competence genes